MATFVLSIHIDPRTWVHAQLLSFPAAGGGRESSSAHGPAAVALTVRSGITRGPTQDGGSENTPDPERHAIADGSDFRRLIPARERQRSVKALAAADVREVFPAFGLCGDSFRRSAFFPISRAVIHANGPDDVTDCAAELHVSRSQLHTATFLIGDRDPLHAVAVNSHVRNAGNVLDQEPCRLAFVDDSAGVLQHLPAVHDGCVVGIRPVVIRHAEPLTRRARHDAAEPSGDAGKLTDIAARDLVRRLNDAKTCARECTVEESDAGEEG